ncbi:hypothetical protein [Sphingomonas astaxanthinifaciens]|uniref:Uncharacterized protein n=1 Tax=Sphingomonas astaxanthinifaciens DSM 22298 TaxID=1123267 RepID=A0ABQ5Z8R1_9SPHN|nr:hypothetical protein [Sphingomonas astaxanthinifaciens]GLR47253.1 hypothetical protein GCM10007925_09640 [Sphingomonas astaxanthinifaciens DSM 22298]
MRTRLSVCRRKAAYKSIDAAMAAAAAFDSGLRAYRCDRCQRAHLTSRRKGKRVPRPVSPVAATEKHDLTVV